MTDERKRPDVLIGAPTIDAIAALRRKNARVLRASWRTQWLCAFAIGLQVVSMIMSEGFGWRAIAAGCMIVLGGCIIVLAHSSKRLRKADAMLEAFIQDHR